MTDSCVSFCCPRTTPRILLIAGTDPTGEAGLVRDIETCCHCSVDASIAVTALNIQDKHGVYQVSYQDPAFVIKQTAIALQAHSITAIKIGMLGNAKIASSLAQFLGRYRHIPKIFDPVLFASSGGPLSCTDIRRTLLKELLPQVTLLTPNFSELAILTGMPQARRLEEAVAQGKKLIEACPSVSVLVKGGHSTETCATDVLLRRDSAISFSAPRLKITMRGTGCILSSAIAAHLAKGYALHEAIESSKKYLFQLLEKKALQAPSAEA